MNMLIHLCTNFFKIIIQDKNDSKESLLKPWIPIVHITMFVRRLDKHKQFCKAIGTSVSDTDKMLFFVVQMYARKI